MTQCHYVTPFLSYLDSSLNAEFRLLSQCYKMQCSCYHQAKTLRHLYVHLNAHRRIIQNIQSSRKRNRFHTTENRLCVRMALFLLSFLLWSGFRAPALHTHTKIKFVMVDLTEKFCVDLLCKQFIYRICYTPNSEYKQIEFLFCYVGCVLLFVVFVLFDMFLVAFSTKRNPFSPSCMQNSWNHVKFKPHMKHS